ncbi:Bifunctional protein GlmU [Symmachiella dynata]|uniref:bifunctional UDP-N-acetylglucosamine diphosphorylase/glucosamine-1-phosphate N-acetyltransferase GlmU n=1 Tax=Symmachiella dynata TaxID=2527995 RepID=UPI00118D20E4|nr:NTP transferase domain-containing protein [Symmachiella dynata]QDT51415.1 Bifunctional protein GlmU [Symmachiella dynata]
MPAAPVAIVLAAGKSTRMKSATPKVLHPLCGRPMIEYVLDAARSAGVERLVVVVGHEAEQVKTALSVHKDVEFALQAEQNGTGHAVMVCEENLRQHDGATMILTGDAPLMQSSSFSALLKDYEDEKASCVIGTAVTENNFGLGRIVRNADGEFQCIVEEKDADAAQKAITEINVGCYVFDNQRLFAALKHVNTDNKQGELYLTDAPAIMLADGQRVVAAHRLTIEEALGVNSRDQLAQVHRSIQDATMQALMLEGTTIVDPAQTYIDPRAQIGRDTTIYPFTTISGPVTIGNNCQIGPHAAIDGTANIPDGTTVAAFERIG